MRAATRESGSQTGNHIAMLCLSVNHVRVVALSLALLSGAFNSTQALAQSSESLLSEQEFFSPIPSVTSVTRLPQVRAETPAAITLIDNTMIRASGARNLVDIFRLVPGFQVAFPVPDTPTLTYHGLGERLSRRMLILIDGRSAYGAFIGNINWANLNLALEDIDRIEVIRGPNSASYGANAFLGTINIITRHAAQIRDTKFRLSAGNHAILDGFAETSTHFSAGDVRISAQYQSDNELDERDDDIKLKSLSLRADLLPGQDDSLMINLGYGQTHTQVGADDNTLNPVNSRLRTLHSEQIEWQHQTPAGDQFSLQFFHNYYSNDQDYLTDPFPDSAPPPLRGVQIPISNDGVEHRYDIEFNQTFTSSDSLRFAWGAGMREDSAQSLEYFNTSDTLTNQSSRLFGSSEWKPDPDVVINSGLMLEKNDVSSTQASPRLALNYHLQDNHTLRVAASKAQRIPTLFEQYADRSLTYNGYLIDQMELSHGQLENESMLSYELGYLLQLPDDQISLDLRLYRDRIKNAITLIKVPSVEIRDNYALDYDNRNEITVDGLDLELTYRPQRATRLILTLAFMEGTANPQGADVVYDKRHIEASIPDFSASLLVMHHFANNWYASLAAYWVDDMFWLADTDPGNRKPAQGYSRLDLRLARSFRSADYHSELSLVVQNVGADYDEFFPRQLFSTRAFVNFELGF